MGVSGLQPAGRRARALMRAGAFGQDMRGVGAADDREFFCGRASHGPSTALTLALSRSAGEGTAVVQSLRLSSLARRGAGERGCFYGVSGRHSAGRCHSRPSQ